MAKSPDSKHQVGALPVRTRDGRVEACLVTTRETRRWTIPKGWPMRDRKDWAAAETEAVEEAGLKGKIGRKPIGSYLYWKRRPDHLDLVRVEVYRLDVTEQLPTWKEASERYVMWFPIGDAAERVDEPGLVAMLRDIAAEPR